MDENTWFSVSNTLQKFQHPGTVCLLLDDRIQLACPLSMDKSCQGLLWMAMDIKAMVGAGLHEQACTLLLICEPLTRVRVIDAWGVTNHQTIQQHLKELHGHPDPKVRGLFEQALVGCLAQALLHPNDDPQACQRVQDCLRRYCSTYALAQLALQTNDVQGFWQHALACSEDDRKSLASQVPDSFWAGGEQADQPPSTQLFAWVRQNIQAGFEAGLSSGLLACANWLDRAQGWGDAALRRAIVRAAVAHALAEQAFSGEPPSAQPNGLAGLLQRAWAEGLRPPLLQALPQDCRERLLSMAVERAANAPTTEDLDGLVDCYLALCNETDTVLDDCLWLSDCLRSAFQQLLAPDSGRDEQARSTIRALRTRMDRGLPDQITDHLKNGRWAAAADGICELRRLAGPAVALEHFERLVEGFKALLKPAGLGFGMTSKGLQVFALSEAADEETNRLTQQANALRDQIAAAGDQPPEVVRKLRRQLDKLLQQLTKARQDRPMRQRLALEQLLSLLQRCGFSEEHPLEAKVLQYLESEAMRASAGDENTARKIHLYRVQTRLAVHTLSHWRPAQGPLWQTRIWLDELVFLGANGSLVLREGEPLRSPAFVDWLDAVCKGATGGALLVDAVAVAMDGEACDAGALNWLAQHFADRVDLLAVLNAMQAPLEAGGPPASGVDRLLRLAVALLAQADSSVRLEAASPHWQPGWTFVFDFCRFLAAQAEPASRPLDDWLLAFVFDDNATASELNARLGSLKGVWLKALANGVYCGPQIQECLMGYHISRGGRFQIEDWEGGHFQRLLSLVEPRAIPPKAGMAAPDWLRHNLAKAVLRSRIAPHSFRSGACPTGGGVQAPLPFSFERHWADAMLSAFRELLPQPDGASDLVVGAEDVAAIWAGAARQFPDWLDKALNPQDAYWVKSLIDLFESGDVPAKDKRERLRAEVERWRKALLAPQAV